MFTLGPTASSEAYSVSLRTLDDVLEEQRVRSVDLIKMDIEGSEYKALCGASKTLARHKPAVLIELSESALIRNGSSAEAIKGLLREAGYRGWVIRPRGAQPLSSEPASHDCDECLFIHIENDALVRKLELQHPAEH